MAVVDPRCTYADLQTMPGDGKRYEVLEGDMVVSPAPKPRHQELVTKLILFLGPLQTARLGKVTVSPSAVGYTRVPLYSWESETTAESHRDLL